MTHSLSESSVSDLSVSETSVPTLSELFDAYDQSTDKIEALEAEADEERFARSDIVAAIAKQIAPRKKVNYKGQVLTLVARASAKKPSELIYFFRGVKQADSNVVVVE